jgi:drug/metabolite transporter (DMT)-like permease
MQQLWRTAWLLMLAPPLFWSGNFITGRAVRDAVPPVALAFWRWAGALAALLRHRPPVHPLSFLVASFALGTLILVPFYLWEMAVGRHIVPGAAAYAAMAYVAVFPSFLAYLAYNRGVELLGSARAGQYIHLMQVFGTVLAVGLLGERFRLFHAVGIGLIGAGLVLAQRRDRERTVRGLDG